MLLAAGCSAVTAGLMLGGWIAQARATHSGYKARIDDGRKELERAFATITARDGRIRQLEFTIDEVRARETQTTFPENPAIEKAIVDERWPRVYQELEQIEDAAGRAEFEELAMKALRNQPDATAEEIIDEVFA